MGRRVGTGILRNWFAQCRPRGAAVPFEAPALQMARVCDDERDGLIAILRDFANNGTAYIVPWTSLPLMASLTDHDVALHQAVDAARASTPAQMRAVVSDLALSGKLGPEARARESEHVRAHRSGLADVELVLILHLLDSNGADLATLMADPARLSDAGAKVAVAAVATTLGVKRKDICQRIAEFAKLLAPVGLVTTQGAILSGWLRVLHDEIDAFGQSIATCAPPDSQEAAAHLAAVAKSAERTARLSGIVLDMLDYAVLDIGGTIRRWNTELPVLRQAIDRLSLTLDEWPALMKAVNDALRDPSNEAAAQLRILRSMLPQVADTDPSGGDRAVDGSTGSPSVSRVLGARLSKIWSMLRNSRANEQ
jgi:hypothetical protein